MGDRYILTVVCPACQHKQDEVYYAPTCGFKDWKCSCGHVVNLEECLVDANCHVACQVLDKLVTRGPVLYCCINGRSQEGNERRRNAVFICHGFSFCAPHVQLLYHLLHLALDKCLDRSCSVWAELTAWIAAPRETSLVRASVCEHARVLSWTRPVWK